MAQTSTHEIHGATVPSSANLLNRASRTLGSLGARCESLATRLCVFAAVALIVAWPLLATAGAMNEFRDAQVLIPYERSAVSSVLDFGQFPLWDPNYCGGMYALGTPQARFVSPTFLLSLLFGTLRAESLTVFFMLIVGLEGVFRYAVAKGASPLGAVFAAPLFALSGNFITAPFYGWTNFYGFELLPWAAYGVHRALRGSLSGAVVGAVAMAWIVGFGGTYAGPMVALLCLFEAVAGLLARVHRPREAARGTLMAALCAALALGLSSVRLWPVATTLMSAPRIVAGTPGMAFSDLIEVLHGDPIIRNGNVVGLQGAFLVGAWCVPAALLGAARLRSAGIVVLGIAAAWTATGYGEGWSPFVGLKSLPVFSALRYPERYLIVVALVASLLAALGLTRAERWAHRAWLGLGLLVVLASLLAASATRLVLTHHAVAEKRMMVPPPPQVERPFHQARGTRWGLAYYGPMSRGCLSCWDAYPVPQSRLLRGDLREEERLRDAEAGTVQQTSWSPNRIDLAVELGRPSRLLVNQNWHAGWRSNLGEVVHEDGLLAVDLPAGSHQVVLRFVPRSAVGGGLASLAAFGVAVWWVRRERRREEMVGYAWVKAFLAVALPFVILFAAWLFIPQAPVLSTPRAQTGEKVIADRVVEGARPLNVRFENGAKLHAVLLESPTVRAGEVTKLELAWETSPGVEPHTGVFTHVQPEQGTFLNMDHHLVSSAVLLHEAPHQKILRDVIPLTLPTDAAQGTWTVWVGLWKVSDGSRVRVTDSGQAEVTNDRVKVATFLLE